MARPADFTASARRAMFEPLVQLLEQELVACGTSLPRPRDASLAQFTQYYLEVVQLLEAGVAAGSERSPMSRGEVELLCRCALCSSDLGEAIELCRRFAAMLHPRAGRLALKIRADEATFQLDSLQLHTTIASSLVDITGLFAFQQLFQWLIGTALPLRQVGIGAIARDDLLPFLKLFKAPVLAGGRHYSLVFGRGALELPVVRTQSEFTEFFRVFPCGIFSFTGSDLPQRVSAILSAAARHGTGIPTQGELSAGLDLSLSTFRRRLAGHGVSFRQLRDDCLRDAARELLARGDVPLADIAVRLGFADASAFRRSFLRWTGESPRARRQR